MQKRYSKEFKETLIAFYHSGQSYDTIFIEKNLLTESSVNLKE
ncbi:hypothetical protein [Lactococcus lactis]